MCIRDSLYESSTSAICKNDFVVVSRTSVFSNSLAISYSCFIKTEGELNYVKVPSIGDILGDKLTAYAPKDVYKRQVSMYTKVNV